MPLDPRLLRLHLGAAFPLCLMPGPDSLPVLTRTVASGRRAGLVATAGITLGNLLHAAAAGVGISALVAASPAPFDLLRYAGAAYLAWIGAAALRAAVAGWRMGGPAAVEAPTPPARRTFVHALTTNLLNAEVILFYLAFVPQFVAPDLGRVPLRTFLLGLALAAMGCAWHVGLAALVARAAQALPASPRVRAGLDAVAGTLFLGFAPRLPLGERRLA
jgi:threonine/homoserine/homoserine lactone efflux protein